MIPHWITPVGLHTWWLNETILMETWFEESLMIIANRIQNESDKLYPMEVVEKIVPKITQRSKDKFKNQLLDSLEWKNLSILTWVKFTLWSHIVSLRGKMSKNPKYNSWVRNAVSLLDKVNLMLSVKEWHEINNELFSIIKV